MRSHPKSILLLMLTAIIWGGAFVAQSVGGEQLGPFLFNAIRSVLGGAVLLPLIPLLGRLSGNWQRQRAVAYKKAHLWQGGIVCGLILGAASCCQQWALQYASVAKAGFITTLYIVIVPLLGWLVFKKSLAAKVWVAVGAALAGLYLLCWGGGTGGIGKGEVVLLVGSVLFSVHILAVDHYSPLVDGVKLSCIQFFVAGIFSGVPALLFETFTLAAVKAAWAPILYAGVLSCGVAYTLQVVAQKRVEPTTASLVLSLESVFRALAGWLLLKQALSGRELFGCLLVFCAVVLAQLPQKKPATKL